MRISDWSSDVCSSDLAIHIATEGPLGMAARKYCTRNSLTFTTAYHTKFPEYIAQRTRMPLSWSYAFMRWFHGGRSEEHTSELQSLMRISYAVFCLKKKTKQHTSVANSVSHTYMTNTKQ